MWDILIYYTYFLIFMKKLCFNWMTLGMPSEARLNIFMTCVVMRELCSMSCIGVLPFIEDLSETVQSGLVASSRNSEEHT